MSPDDKTESYSLGRTFRSAFKIVPNLLFLLFGVVLLTYDQAREEAAECQIMLPDFSILDRVELFGVALLAYFLWVFIRDFRLSVAAHNATSLQLTKTRDEIEAIKKPRITETIEFLGLESLTSRTDGCLTLRARIAIKSAHWEAMRGCIADVIDFSDEGKKYFYYHLPRSILTVRQLEKADAGQLLESAKFDLGSGQREDIELMEVLSKDKKVTISIKFEDRPNREPRELTAGKYHLKITVHPEIGKELVVEFDFIVYEDGGVAFLYPSATTQ